MKGSKALSSVAPNDEVFEQIRYAIESRSAICLLGAGFSIGATDGSGRNLPSVSELTQEIKIALEIPEEEIITLADAADIAQDSIHEKKNLNSLLIQRLTSTQPTGPQRWIASLNWRSIFTTNFDDIIEQAGDSRRIFPITPATDASTIPSTKTPLYYMHGRALDLRERDCDPSIVISESNYLQLDKRNRNLYSRLFNDVSCARIVIIIGYSLRDLEIASKFLAGGPSTREKTYIVCAEADSAYAVRRLAKFGTVLAIGLEAFVDKIKAVDVSKAVADDKFYYLEEHFPEDNLSQPEDEVGGDDFLSIVLSGSLKPDKFLRQNQNGDYPYCVTRSEALDIVSSNGQQRIIVSSDFGNGKTAFLVQLATRLTVSGHRVFLVKTKLREIFEEIDRALSLSQPTVFLIDDVVRYREISAYIGPRLHNQSRLVCTTRGDQDAQYEQLAGEMGGSHRFIDLNRLTDSELLQWDHLLERWGYWEQRSALPSAQRVEFLSERCGRENRSIILSLFENSQIGSQIDHIVGFFLKDTRIHLNAFCGLLISSLCQRHVSWDSIVNWLEIDDDQLRIDLAKSDVAFLFARGRNWNIFTSAQLAEYILRNKFVESERDTLVEVYSRIVLKTADSSNDERSGYDFRENLKELMKFRFLEKLFGETESAGSLISSVYRRLSDAPRIRGNPQFWLQYAMSRMKVNDLANAETFINTALGRTKEQGLDYSPFQILDQRARLFFRKNTVKGRSVSRNEISTALNDLTELAKDQNYDIVYTMRSLPLISDFLEERIDDIDEKMRSDIAKFISQLKEKTARFDRLPRSQRGETKVLKSAMRDVELILFNA